MIHILRKIKLGIVSGEYKNITLGKWYNVIGIESSSSEQYWSYFLIIDDSCKIKWINPSDVVLSEEEE